MITFKEYINDVEYRCPFCNSTRNYSWDQGHSRQGAEFIFSCQDCNGEWRQHYEISRVTYVDPKMGLTFIMEEE